LALLQKSIFSRKKHLRGITTCKKKKWISNLKRKKHLKEKKFSLNFQTAKKIFVNISNRRILLSI